MFPDVHVFDETQTMWPLPLKCRAMSTTACSLTPFLITALTFIGPRPAAAATSIASENRRPPGTPTSFIPWKVGSSIRVEADGGPIETGCDQTFGLARQRNGASGESEVLPTSLDPPEIIAIRSSYALDATVAHLP